MTGPRPDTAGVDAQGLASVPRVLSPDEFQQARMLSPAQLGQAKFPVLPPAFAPRESTRVGLEAPKFPALPPTFAPRESTRVGAEAPSPDAHKLTGLPRILTQYVAQPIMDHPLMTAATALIPGAGFAMTGLMGKDIMEYAAQKAAEATLPPDVRAGAEADPDRIPGERVAVEAAMLGVAPLIHGIVKRIKAPSTPTAAGAGIVRAHVDAITDSWKTIFAPASRSPEAMQAANIIRSTTGHMAASYEQAAFKLDEFRRAVEPLPDADKLGFIDAIEGGKSQPSPEFQKAADTIRQTLDETRDAIRALGTGKLDHFIEDYFPHIWTDPDRAAAAFKVDPLTDAKINAGGKRPMEGGKSFLKERTIPTTAEGMAAGLTPVSMNPVDLTLIKLREMQRYLMAHQSLNEMKDNGLVKFVTAGGKRPDGYARINDNIATVFAPREGMVTLPEGANVAPEDVGVIGRRMLGEYWAPETVATVVNNYLSPGLRGNAIYDAYRGLGNTLNQAQLGLSAFHLGFTSMDASVSRAALGVEYIASGKPLKGLAEMASAPLAPVTNMRLGAKIRSAYLNPENASPEMQALANAVKEAGGRVRQDSFYQNSAPEKMIAAWREGSYGKATALSLPSLLEMTAKPIMEHIVPMQKLGVFGDLAKKVLTDLPPEATLADRRASLARAWDSVDNRMGQVVYDNLFWNKTFKDLAMGSVRSVGWNLGTIRELGGGLSDIAKNAAKLPSGEAEMTHRAAYVAALPLTVGMYGALYQYLRTGEGPSEFKDYFYPKTGEVDADGNPERVQLASYMKDLFAYAGHPWETVKHKMAPILSGIGEMLENQDFYGDQIRNPDDPAVKQLMQEASFIAEQAVPFSFRNVAEQTKRGDQSAVTKFGNWFGVTPAPRKEVRSAAQNRMADFQQQRQTSGSTPEDAEARQSRAALLSAMRAGKGGPELDQAVSDAIERHQLTPKSVVDLLKRAGMTPAQEKFKHLTLAQAVEVYKLGTPREQGLFAEALMKKLGRASQAAP